MADIVRKPEVETALTQQEKHEEVSLNGTFVSVLLLGGFLALTWLAVFILFVTRN